MRVEGRELLVDSGELFFLDEALREGRIGVTYFLRVVRERERSERGPSRAPAKAGAASLPKGPPPRKRFRSLAPQGVSAESEAAVWEVDLDFVATGSLGPISRKAAMAAAMVLLSLPKAHGADIVNNRAYSGCNNRARFKYLLGVGGLTYK